MKCDSCVQLATVHLIEVVGKAKKELHLCEDCAKSKGVTIQHPVAAAVEAAALTHPPVVSKTKVALRRDELSSLTCPSCKMTFQEFRSGGRLGCAQCYQAFGRGLVPLLEKIHGKSEHRGRMPRRVVERAERQDRLAKLREELNRAIQREEYERAAELRDQIYGLEEKR